MWQRPSHLLGNSITWLVKSNALRAIVVDDAEQLNERGLTLLLDCMARTGCQTLFVGDRCHLWKCRLHIVLLDCFLLIWKGRNDSHV